MTDHIKYGEEAESMQWIGVDLDGTLAADPWQGFEHIGKPIPNMMKRVKIGWSWIPREDRNGQSSRPRSSHSAHSGMA